MAQERAFSGTRVVNVSYKFTKRSPNYFTALHSSSGRVHCIVPRVDIYYYAQNEL